MFTLLPPQEGLSISCQEYDQRTERDPGHGISSVSLHIRVSSFLDIWGQERAEPEEKPSSQKHVCRVSEMHSLLFCAEFFLPWY